MLHLIKDIIRLHSPKVPLSTSLRSAIGIFLAVFIMLVLHQFIGFPLVFASLSASAFLVFAAPAALFAQPANVILGNVLGCSIAVLFLLLHNDSLLLIAFATGLCTFMMIYLRIPHPPAVAFPIMLFLLKPDAIFTLFSVVFASIIIVLLGIIFHWFTHTEYPIKITRAKF